MHGIVKVKFTSTISFIDILKLFWSTKAVDCLLSWQSRIMLIIGNPNLPLWQYKLGDFSNYDEGTEQNFYSIKPDPCHHHPCEY